jgi:hypothetical protein
MTENTARRRGHGEDAIYFDATKNRYVGPVSLGFRPDGKRSRRKVSGRTKQEVRELRWDHVDLDRDPDVIRMRSGRYRRRWPCGGRCVSVATPRRASRG